MNKCIRNNYFNDKQVLPKIIWDDHVTLAQLRSKVPTGYNKRPKFTPKTAPSPLMITAPI